MAGEGFKYFNIDTDRYQDMRIKRLKNAHSCCGIAVYDFVLCEIYRVRGYILEWDSNISFDIADYFRIEEKRVEEIVSFCCELGLFNKELFQNKSLLTSKSIQLRFLEMSKRAKRIYVTIPEELNVIQEKVIEIPEKTIEVHEEIIDPTKDSKPKLPTWKTDIEIYFTDLRNSFQSIKDDHVWITQQELFNPGIDVILSIEKSCVNYWATEAGWKKKKSSKIINIDWKSTFANAISINKVYKSQSNGSNKQLQVGNNTEAERKRAIVAHATGESQPNEKAFF